MGMNTCDSCGKIDVKNLKIFNTFSHITPCIIELPDGTKRHGWKPVFINEKELCFTCYNHHVKYYK